MNDARLQLKTILPISVRHQNWVNQLSLRVHDLPARTMIFTPGEVPQRIYVLAKGWVAGSVSVGKHKTAISHLRLRGDMIGLNSLAGQPAISSATSLTSVQMISAPREELFNLLRTDPKLSQFLYLEQSRDIAALQIFNSVIGQLKAPNRLACFLLIMFARLQDGRKHARAAIHLPLTQEEIGQLLGLTNVSVNRAFRTLEKEALIATRRQLVSILDLKGLIQRAQLSNHLDVMALFSKDLRALARVA